MNVQFLSLLFFLALRAANAFADYEPTLLPELIKKSDLIIEGEILSVYGKYVSFKPITILKRHSTVPIIKVDKFVDWTCAHRFDSYKPRQKEFLFLKFNKMSGHYYPLGAENEGEMPAIGNFIYYKDQYLAIDTAVSSFKVYGGVVRGYKYDRHQFIKAVTGFSGHNSQPDSEKISPLIVAVDTSVNEVNRRIVAELHIYDK